MQEIPIRKKLVCQTPEILAAPYDPGRKKRQKPKAIYITIR